MYKERDNPIKDKSYAFALSIVKLTKIVRTEHNEYILTNQLLRSATSIGANVEEAIGSASDKDFLYRITIAYKEARETQYWLRLLIDSDYLGHNEGSIYLTNIVELLKIMTAIQKTLKARIEKNK